MAGESDNVELKMVFGGDAEGAVGAARKAERALRDVSKAADTTSPATEAASQALGKVGDAAGGLVGSLGTLALAYLSVEGALEAFNIALDEAKENAQADAFEKLGGDVDGLKKALDGLVDNDNVARIGAYAKSFGLTNEQMEALAGTARDTARVMGTDTAQAFEALAQGVATGNARLLRQAGLMIDVDEAMTTFARSIGTTKDRLNEAGKEAAIFNAVMEAQKDLHKKLGDETDTDADKLERFKTSALNLADTLKGNLVPALVAITDKLKPMVDTVTDLINELGLAQGLLASFGVAFGGADVHIVGGAQATAEARAANAAADAETDGFDMGTPVVTGGGGAGARKKYTKPLDDSALIKMEDYARKVARTFEDFDLALAGVVGDMRISGGLRPQSTDQLPMPAGSFHLPQLDIDDTTHRLQDNLEITADEFEAMNQSADGQITVVNDTVGRFQDMGRQMVENLAVTKNWQDGIQAARDALADAFSPENLSTTIGNLANAIAQGHGGAQGGQQLGAIVGGIVDVASGGATGGLGATLGGVLGGVFGTALDKLVDSLGVLSPLFDAVGDIIGALAPILAPIKVLFEGVRIVIQTGVLPVLRDLIEPIGQLIMVIAELVVAAAPWIGALLDVALSLITLAPLLNLLATPLEYLVGATVNLGRASIAAYNGVVRFVNMLYDVLADYNTHIGNRLKEIDVHGNTLSAACFVPSTPVATANGTRPIVSIEVGDHVWGRHEDTLVIELCRVTKVHRARVDEVIVLHVGDQRIGTTESHRFWTTARGWVKAGELAVGDHLVQLHATTIRIDAIERRPGPVEVCNLEVDRTHTFYVGAQPVLVHNGDKEKQALKEAKEAARQHEKNTKALQDNTKAINAQQNNLSPGWKGFNASAFNSAPTIINIANWNSARGLTFDLTELRNMTRNGSRNLVMSKRGIGDDKG